MQYIGVDIIEIDRIQQAVERWGERFLHRIYTDAELKLCRGKSESLAVRFAGKEAAVKALGTGIRGVGWKDIEILAEPSGKPLVNLYRQAPKKANDLGLRGLAISLSHSREYAIAFVVGEKE
ncbi:MAG TPA: holo-[acyl-carrier-protein] synthase [Dehalococcoidia bacterium]|nr:holo-[acyl-carrier-protein] synthase [Dehalococcoidia bacterium]